MSGPIPLPAGNSAYYQNYLVPPAAPGVCFCGWCTVPDVEASQLDKKREFEDVTNRIMYLEREVSGLKDEIVVLKKRIVDNELNALQQRVQRLEDRMDQW